MDHITHTNTHADTHMVLCIKKKKKDFIQGIPVKEMVFGHMHLSATRLFFNF